MKKAVILIIGVSLSLSMQASDLQQSTFAVTIPRLNIPIEFKRTKNPVTTGSLGVATISHGWLAYKQLGLQKTAQELLLEHALLAASRVVIGAGSTICHELAHAIFAGGHNRKIEISWSPVNLLLGGFDGGLMKSDDTKPIPDKNNSSDKKMSSLKNIAYLNRLDDFYSESIACSVSGPVVGVLSAYTLYKGLTTLHPACRSAYAIMGINVVQNAINLLPMCTFGAILSDILDNGEQYSLRTRAYECLDGDHLLQAWRNQKNTRNSKARLIEDHIRSYPEDGSRDFSLCVVEK